MDSTISINHIQNNICLFNINFFDSAFRMHNTNPTIKNKGSKNNIITKKIVGDGPKSGFCGVEIL